MSGNQYVMTSAQLKADDVITEMGLRDPEVTEKGKRVAHFPERRVQVSSAVRATISYKGHPMLVWYVTGTDLASGKVVKWTANDWRRWLTTRTPAALADAVA